MLLKYLQNKKKKESSSSFLHFTVYNFNLPCRMIFTNLPHYERQLLQWKMVSTQKK